MRKISEKIGWVIKISPIAKGLQFYTCIVLFFGAFSSSYALNVVTSSPDLASIAEYVGGNEVTVDSLAKADDDLHHLAARPDYILKTGRADVFIFIGLDLEVGWLPLVLRRSGNGKVQNGGQGHCNASDNIPVLEKPSGTIDRQMGDVHAQGNPHYWTDPVNGIRIAQTIAGCLAKVDPSNAKRYVQNAGEFKKRLTKKTAQWLGTLKSKFGRKVFTYHKEFSYFAKRFRLNIVGTVEKLPGVPPGTADMNAVVAHIKREGVKVILVTPWNNLSYAREAARRSGAKMIVLPIQSDPAEGRLAYENMMAKIVSILKKDL